MYIIFILLIVIAFAVNHKVNKKEIEKRKEVNNILPKKTLTTNDDIIFDNYELPSMSLINEGQLKKALTSLSNQYNILMGINDDNYVFKKIYEMPNMLVGGTVMSGKTSYINNIICTLLMNNKPDELKLLLFDYKKVELSMYNGIPHLLAPVITNSNKTNIVLKKIVVEMEKRYDLFSRNGIKNIIEYNTNIDKKNELFSEKQKIKYMPYILIIIDDFSMLSLNEENDKLIEMITQKGWNIGIHIIATVNYPSSRVISAISKSNFPIRVSFRTATAHDSRIVLGEVGAEKLEIFREILYKDSYSSSAKILNVPFISDAEIKKIVDHTIKQQITRYNVKSLLAEEKISMVQENAVAEEPLYNEIVEFVVTQGKASASLLQRRFHLGYNRAVRAIDLLEERGIVGPNNGSKPREVLVKLENQQSDE